MENKTENKDFTKHSHRIFGHPYVETVREDCGSDYVVCECGDKIYLPLSLFSESTYKFGGLI